MQGHRETRPHSLKETQPLWLELATPDLKAGSSVRLKNPFSLSLATGPSQNRVFGVLVCTPLAALYPVAMVAGCGTLLLNPGLSLSRVPFLSTLSNGPCSRFPLTPVVVR